ncbi:MAG: hypothetical protein GF313_03590 [Caldithrix sp.]|nr:hypothetical protein [Caldithrix sp.]
MTSGTLRHLIEQRLLRNASFESLISNSNLKQTIHLHLLWYRQQQPNLNFDS